MEARSNPMISLVASLWRKGERRRSWSQSGCYEATGNGLPEQQ